MFLSLVLLRGLSHRLRFIFFIVLTMLFAGCSQLSKSDNDNQFNSGEEPLTQADKMPEYKGGTEKLIQYISKEVKYPPNAKDMDVEGTVQVSFVVNKDGSISDANIEKGVYSELNDEALRVVESMPNWIPAKHKGKKVAVKLMLPIRFELPKDKK